MALRKSVWFPAIGWILLILLALLLPAPREWGSFGRWISPRYDQVQAFIQPMAHVFLMAVLSFILMKGFSGRQRLAAVLFSAGISLGVAALFEGLQCLLPPGFGRSGDIGDIAYSLVGIGMGCLIGLRACCRRNRYECLLAANGK